MKNFQIYDLRLLEKGNLENSLRQKALDYHVEDKIDFEGFQNNIAPFYLYAKGTLLTSIYEGYPNVLIESIAMNTPVVSFDCPNGPSEIIQDGVNGYLAKHLDVKDLINKIILMLQNKFDYEDLKISIEKK